MYDMIKKNDRFGGLNPVGNFQSVQRNPSYTRCVHGILISLRRE